MVSRPLAGAFVAIFSRCTGAVLELACLLASQRVDELAEDPKGPFLEETLEARGSSYNGYPATRRHSFYKL